LNILITISLGVAIDCYSHKLFSNNLDTEPSLSTLYARDKNSDLITSECLAEMYPRNLYKYPPHIDRNDIPCIIHCVLKKFGIMSNDGIINIRNYYRRVQAIHRYDPRVLISDVGETCAQNINGMNLDHDVCKKAKVFNDCTQFGPDNLRHSAMERAQLGVSLCDQRRGDPEIAKVTKLNSTSCETKAAMGETQS
ncbi:jg24360, partial [Pararge aegeria aegeria]